MNRLELRPPALDVAYPWGVAPNLAPPPRAARAHPPLSAAFLSAMREGARARAAAQPDLEAALEQMTADAADGRHWLTPARFARYLGERFDGDLLALHAHDLYLACGCLDGIPAALDELDKHYLPVVLSAVSRVEPTFGLPDEAQQVLRERLLISAGTHRPRIADYDGRGPLKAWLRTAGVRIAQALRRTAVRQRGFDHALAEETALLRGAALDDPELMLAQARFRDELKTAFVQALRSLEPAQREVLELSVIDGLSIDDIGASRRVHRATAARLLARAKALLVSRTRRGLGDRLKLNPAELINLMQTGRSTVELSLGGLFSSAGQSSPRG